MDAAFTSQEVWVSVADVTVPAIVQTIIDNVATLPEAGVCALGTELPNSAQ